MLQVTKSDQNTNVLSSFQSEELIHELLTVALHSISFLRYIFNENSYQWSTFRAENCDCENPLEPLKYKQLIRGSDPNVDRFLDWIHQGVFEAVNRRYLNGLQLAIATDPEQPELVHESYLFHIDYTETNVTVVSLENKATENGVTIQESESSPRDKVLALIKRLIMLTQGLAPLPRFKRISIALLFNDTCNQQYQPPGFADTQGYQFPPIYHAKGKCVTSLPSINTGFHTLGLSVFSSVVQPLKQGFHDYALAGTEPGKLAVGVVLHSSDGVRINGINTRATKSHTKELKVCECNFLLEGKLPQKKFNCCRCQRACHYKCYMYIVKLDNVCFSCILGCPKVDFDILLLMRARMLYAYLKIFSFPRRLLQIGNEVFNLANENTSLFINRLLMLYLANGVIVPIEQSAVSEVGCGEIFVDIQLNAKVANLANNNPVRDSQIWLAFYPIAKRAYPKKLPNAFYNANTVRYLFTVTRSCSSCSTPAALRSCFRTTLKRGGYFKLASVTEEVSCNHDSLGRGDCEQDDPAIDASRCPHTEHTKQAENQSICAPLALFRSPKTTSFMHEPKKEHSTAGGHKGEGASHTLVGSGRSVRLQYNYDTEESIDESTISDLALGKRANNNDDNSNNSHSVLSDDIEDVTFEDSFAMLSQRQTSYCTAEQSGLLLEKKKLM